MKRKNPKQVFVIISTTREEIAADVNSLIENEGWDIPKLEEDDPRLTDKFCKAFAEASNDAISETDEVVDREYEWQKACIASEFGISTEDDES